MGLKLSLTLVLRQWKMDSPIGPLYLIASEKGLKSVLWKAKGVPFAATLTEHKILAQAVQELTEYFDRNRLQFSVPLDVEGTEFQERVWKQLAQIPYGKTFSYSEIAVQIGQEKAVRAVGTANGRNPLSIVVPCHRVIAANGTLGGYSGGLAIKTKLLELERNRPSL